MTIIYLTIKPHQPLHSTIGFRMDLLYLYKYIPILRMYYVSCIMYHVSCMKPRKAGRPSKRSEAHRMVLDPTLMSELSSRSSISIIKGPYFFRCDDHTCQPFLPHSLFPFSPFLDFVTFFFIFFLYFIFLFLIFFPLYIRSSQS